MTPSSRLQLQSAGYAALLCGLNWYHVTEYSRRAGVVKVGVMPVVFDVLLSGAVACYLAYRCVEAFRGRREGGRQAGNGWGIRHWGVLGFLIPLLVAKQNTSSWLEPDGVLATVKWGYGHALSGWVLFFGSSGMLLYQVLEHLAGDP